MGELVKSQCDQILSTSWPPFGPDECDEKFLYKIILLFENMSLVMLGHLSKVFAVPLLFTETSHPG